jgi:hypothetical protein
VVTTERRLSPLGKLLLVPRRSKIAKGFYGPAFPTAGPPAGWRVVAQDRSYRLFAAPSCVTAPPS